MRSVLGWLLLVPYGLSLALRAKTVPGGGRSTGDGTGARCTSPIYCEGPLLETVQRSGLYHDSKTFVDMPGRFSEATILENFARLGPHPREEELAAFVAANFYRPGSDLRAMIPRDWQPHPPVLAAIKDGRLRELALTIHGKWKALVRVVDPDRIRNGTATSTIPLPCPFVVPGGRFRELYYWDSFWILEGLYVSGMCETATFMVENLAWLVSKFGFIPNGSRKYYLNRSQPPLFAQICERFLQECVPAGEQGAWLGRKLPLLDQEYTFWMTRRVAEAPLNRYYADTEVARPEAFKQDTLLAETVESLGAARRDRGTLFRELAAGAESGWDFTVRWFGGSSSSNLTQISVTNVIPVDLNAIMYRNEIILGRLHEQMGDAKRHEDYLARARRRLEAMDRDLLKEGRGWFDRDALGGQSMADSFAMFSSNLAPIWYDALNSEMLDYSRLEALLLQHDRILFEYPGGIPNNAIASGEQWDFPNVWPLVQYHFVNVFELLERLAPKHAAPHWRARAVGVAQRFVKSVHCGFKNYGQFFEKYHAQMVGQPGGGGEYIVQDGFGWTNGVALWMIKKYADQLNLAEECPPLATPAVVRRDLFDLGMPSDVAFRKRERMDSIRQTVDRHSIWVAMLIGLILVLTLMGVTVVAKHEHFAESLFGGRESRRGESRAGEGRPGESRLGENASFLVLPLQDPHQLDLRSLFPTNQH